MAAFAAVLPMPSPGKIKRWSVVWFAGYVLTLEVATAGNVPLFRCALEEWPAQNYQAVLFHRGPLNAEEQDLAGDLGSASAKTGVNLLFSTLDLREELSPPLQALWEAQVNAEPPWLVVLSPEAAPEPKQIWAGPLKADAVKTILDSPARRKITEGLLRGDAAVWVLLECGEAVRDEAAVDMLATSLKQMERELRLPSAAALPVKSPMPLRIGFSLVRIPQNDPAEEFLLRQLPSGGGAWDRSRPVAHAVFGRGRTLPSFAGKRLQAETIREIGRLLTNGCTNGMAAAQAGTDLLLAADWNSIFNTPAPADTNLNAVSKLMQIMTNASQSSPAVPTNAVEPVPAPANSGGGRLLIFALLAAAGIAGGFWLVMRGRERR
jgi:hypothetical protein